MVVQFSVLLSEFFEKAVGIRIGVVAKVGKGGNKGINEEQSEGVSVQCMGFAGNEQEWKFRVRIESNSPQYNPRSTYKPGCQETCFARGEHTSCEYFSVWQ